MVDGNLPIGGRLPFYCPDTVKCRVDRCRVGALSRLQRSCYQILRRRSRCRSRPSILTTIRHRRRSSPRSCSSKRRPIADFSNSYSATVHRRRAATRNSGTGRRPSRTTTEVMATRLSIHAWIRSATTAAWIRASSGRKWRTVEGKRPARSSSIRRTIFFISSRVKAGRSATASASAAPDSPGQARTRFRKKGMARLDAAR